MSHRSRISCAIVSAVVTIASFLYLVVYRPIELHWGATSAEVARTFKLFAGIVADAQKTKFDKQESYPARQGVANPPADPHYTIRAWRGVVTYLLRRPEFLYE